MLCGAEEDLIATYTMDTTARTHSPGRPKEAYTNYIDNNSGATITVFINFGTSLYSDGYCCVDCLKRVIVFGPRFTVL